MPALALIVEAIEAGAAAVAAVGAAVTLVKVAISTWKRLRGAV